MNQHNDHGSCPVEQTAGHQLNAIGVSHGNKGQFVTIPSNESCLLIEASRLIIL